MKNEIIYNHSPIFIQNLMTSLYGMVLHWQRYAGHTGKQYERII